MNRFEQFKETVAKMTLKELAEYINKYLEEDACEFCDRSVCHNGYETCVDGIIDYLEGEVE